MTVERERQDVGFLVLLFLSEPLLELALFLEAVFLGHLPLLLLGLHDAAFLAEAVELAAEQLVLAELTLKRTIEKRNLDAGFQAYLVEALFTVGQDPCVASGELVLQSLAHHAVGA